MPIKGLTIHNRIRNDDISAFEVLFKNYYARLVEYAYLILRDMDASEEIVQDFFYNYWKNRKEISIRFSVKAYFFRSVRNNCLNYLEAVKVRRKYAEKVISGLKEDAGYTEEGLELAELNELLEDTLSELPDRCSRIFRMSRFEGKKYEEIAGELSVSVKTVEANMGKALRLLRERLKHYNHPGVAGRGT